MDHPESGPSPEFQALPENDKIEEWQKKAKQFRQELHESEKHVRELQERIWEMEKHMMKDHAELSQLREILFHIKSGEKTEESLKEEEIAFPWKITRKVLVFGGRDSWKKALRILLPGAYFFDRESLPDANTIKNADVVWIYANAISHKFYNHIIEIARKESIPVRYFGFSGARKCAELLRTVRNNVKTSSYFNPQGLWHLPEPL